MLIEILTLLAVLNATIAADQNIPLEVEVNPASTPVQPVAPQVPAPIQQAQQQSITIDVATITAILGAVGTFAAMFKKTVGKTDSRLNAVADTVTRVAESVKGTDIGAKDTAEKVAKLAEVVESAPPELKNEVVSNAEEWKKDSPAWPQTIPAA